MNWIYPEVINDLKIKCHSFLKKELSVKEIQSAIYVAENQILASEEKWLREILFEAENQIELSLYTMDDNQSYEHTEYIIKAILDKISQ